MGSHKISHAFQGNIDFIHCGCITASYMSFPGRPESISGNRSDIFLLQQGGTEFFAAHAGFAYGGEDIKRTVRFEAVESHPAERVNHQPAAAVIALTHGNNAFIPVLPAGPERSGRGDLSLPGRAHDGILMNLVHYGDDFLCTAGIPDTPSGHGESLAESVDCDCPCIHIAADGSERDMVMIAIYQFRIDFIGYNKQIMISK